MDKPLFIPKTKADMSACSILLDTSDAEIKPHLAELLTWLQDSNWPVAYTVSLRLQQVGVELAPETS